MTFPTIPTVADGRALSSLQANTTATRTFPNLSSITKNPGDLLLAIILAYQGPPTGTDAAFSGWGAGFTECHDSATSGTMAIGIAYKWSDGTESGTFTVTQAGAALITGHAVMAVLSIPGAHQSTPPEVGGRASGTNTAATPDALNPAGWDVEDTLWLMVGGCGETGGAGSFTGIASGNPTNYTGAITTNITADAVGGLNASVAFRELAAASEDPPAFSNDTSNARWGAVTIAIRPAPAPTTGAATGAVSWAGSATGERASSGATSGALAYAGSATGVTVHSGAATGSVAWSGTATGVAPTSVKQGSAAGSVSWSGAAAGARAPAGSTSGAVSWSGSATGARTSTGSASGTVARTGSATGARPSTGSAVGTLTYAGSTTGTRTSAGSVAGVAAWTGSATGSAPTVGAASGSVAGAVAWTGSATGARASLGAAAAAVTWAGSATGSSAAALVVSSERTSDTRVSGSRTSTSGGADRTSTSPGVDRTSS